MANVVADTGDAGSNLVAGAGTNSATFTMPGTVALNVESVVATVDNAAGGDTTALLTIKDQSGVVIATKRQDDSIPAGDTGTATFALRLDSTSGGIRYRKVNTGEWLDVRTTGTEGISHDSLRFDAFEDFHVTSGREINFDAFGGTDFNVSTGNDINLFPNNDANVQALNNVNISGNGTTNVQGVTGLNLQGGPLQSTNSQVGFFGATPVAQAATPTTLAQVITILRNLGFAA